LTGTGTSPITISGLTNGTAYTFTVTATNANGTSAASSASNSVTPVLPLGTIGTWTSNTTYPVDAWQIRAASGSGANWLGLGGLNSTFTNSINGSYRWSTSGSFTSYPPSMQTQQSSISGDANGNMQSSGTYFTSGGSGSIDSQSIYWTGSAWAGATSLPAARGYSGAIGWGGNLFSVTGGYNSDFTQVTTTYYRTGTGAFSTGTSAPIANFQNQAFYAYGKGYLNIYNGATTPIYSATSPTGTWTFQANMPVGGNRQAAAVSLNTAFIITHSVIPSAVYRYNGTSTFALQNSVSGTDADYMNIAGTSSTISQFGGWRNFNGGTAYNVHYTANVT
jgi:hypothetical protein